MPPVAALVDVLRRAGASVTVASVEAGLQVVMSRQIKLVADKSIEDVAAESFDLIALPVSLCCSVPSITLCHLPVRFAYGQPCFTAKVP